MTVEERVKNVIARQLKVKLEDIKDDSDFVKDLGADSMASIELVAAFEAEFDIEMDEDAALSVKTVGKAVEFIENILKRQ
ncbi:MAG: acyl carrier protein [candidate division KSB1 bacterium]|nr:acyl carrier protein [candidate division KSB1 bacterium]MDZ7358024.1 acyl carrier protein [candidate division KSB1 bacterium]MDZ7375748.1 acyl carrier protein [candidate division KSB1 bacterium]MDZ7399425.1 acyl carrier protein [candidate division KSB1 bacterium]